MKTITGTTIEVTTVGSTYGQVVVSFPSGEVQEYSIPASLARVLSKVK